MSQQTGDSQGINMGMLIALAGNAGSKSSITFSIKDGDDPTVPTRIPVANIVAYMEDRLVVIIPGHTTPSTIRMEVIVGATVTADSD